MWGTERLKRRLTLDEDTVGKLSYVPPLRRPRSHCRAKPTSTSHLRKRIVIVKGIAHLEIDLSSRRIEGIAVHCILLPYAIGRHRRVATARVHLHI